MSQHPNSDQTTGGLDLQKLLSGFKRRRKTFVLTLIIGMIASVLALVFIPASYLSKSTILIEQQEIPAELVRSTVTSYADQRIETITQRVMTTKNLWDIVEKYDLYPDEREKETRQYVLELMRDKGINRNVISAEVVDPRSGRPTEATIAFQLSFKYENPQLAQRVANELTTLFLSENLKTRTEMADQAESFLTTEAQKMNERVLKLEQDLAEFKEKNFDALPELTDLNIRMLDRTEQALRENELARGTVKERLVFLESQLAQVEPNAPIVSGQGERMLSSASRLKFTKQQYEQALARYSDSHPEVQRLYKEMTGLMGDVPDDEAPQLKLDIFQLQLKQARARYSDEHPTVQKLEQAVARVGAMVGDKTMTSNENADNPAWLQLNAQFESAQLELASFDERAALLRADLKKYENRITEAPRIEQTYQQLSRDYQSAVIKYAEIRAKQQEASLGQSLESEQKGERFTLIEPPLVPEEPHSPNRKLIAVMGVFLSLGLAVGLVVLREMMDKTIRGRKALIQAMGAAPLAIIPMIVTPDESAIAKRNVWLAVLVCLLGVAAVLGVFHVFIKPLDVTWYMAMRKFGWM